MKIKLKRTIEAPLKELSAFTALTASLTTVLGLMLVSSGEYNEASFFWHKWLGIGFSVVMIFVAVFYYLAHRFKVYGLLLATILMICASHQGGVLTHGENHFKKSARQLNVLSQPKKFVASSSLPLFNEGSGNEENDSIDFHQFVKPILESACYKCHGPTKSKGNLRLDSVEAILKGGKNGAVVVKGHPEKSSLYLLTILPPDDVDIMPSKGDPLKKEQTEIIRKWILEGAAFGNQEEPVVTRYHGQNTSNEATDLDLIGQNLKPLDEKHVEQLTSYGVRVKKISKNGLLDVDFSALEENLNQNHLNALAPIASHVVWLDLSSQKLSQLDLSVLAQMNFLRRLHLEKTAITNEALNQLSGLTHLEYLNLNETNVDSVGVLKLSALKSLRNLYLWKTKASKSAAEQLKQKNKDLNIVLTR